MNIKELRKENRKSQKEVATYLHMTQSNYGKYELGDLKFNLEQLIKLADYYNVSLDYLVGREFVNDFGFINESDKNLLKSILLLSEQNKYKVATYAVTLLASQN